MNLKKVYIYSGMTAQRAQDKINGMLAEYEDSDMSINFELKIENSVIVGKASDTRYTLVVYVYESITFDDLIDYGRPQGE